MAKTPSGYIIYRGPSMLDGKPIVVVAITKKSSNVKTGDMVQTYILADNGKSPVETVKALEDASICGDCKHRRGTGGACYVNLGQGPRAVADGVVRGIYPHIRDSEEFADLSDLGKDRIIRLGTYGDPAAVPEYVWWSLLVHAKTWTGYTHQWKDDRFQWLKAYVMASADSAFERWDAKDRGWRTFRIRTGDDAVLAGEFLCPASKEGGERVQCFQCTACDGNARGSRKADPVIIVHGSLASRFARVVSLA
jgi:hypothetical protein